MRRLLLIGAENEICTKVDVELFRQGKTKAVQITFVEVEKAELVGLSGGDKSSPGDAKQSFGSLGFSVQNLTPKITGEMGLDAEKTGVVVSEGM